MNLSLQVIKVDSDNFEQYHWNKNSNSSSHHLAEEFENKFKGLEHSIISELSAIKLGMSSFSHEVSYFEVADILNKETKPVFKSTKNFIIGLIWLMLTIVSCAMIGPLVLSLPAKNPFISCAWRTQGSILFVIPITLYIYKTKKTVKFRDDIQPDKLLRSFVNAVFMVGWLMGLIIGCSKTITSHAHIMYSSTGVYVLLFSLIARKIIHKFEVFGYFLLAIGVLIALNDPLAMKKGETNEPMLGCLIAFSGAGFGAVYGIINQTNSRIFHPIIMMTQLFWFMTIIQLLTFSYFQDNPKFYSFDPEYGVFGWVSNLETFLYMLVVVVPITSILANLAFLKSLEYWPLEIVSIGLLWEPFISELVAVILGQDNLPGIQTLLGIVVISVGLVMASYGAKLKATDEIARLRAEMETPEENEMSEL
jgi:hypothetical protein